MKNAKDKKMYSAAELLAAKLQGKKEAEEFLQKRINFICITHHQLLVEIMRLDWETPVACVHVPYTYAEKLIRKLRKNKMYGYANRLQGFIDKSNPIDLEKALELLEELAKSRSDN